MATFNVSKTTVGPSPVVVGSVIRSTVTVENASPAYSNDYTFQIGMGDWVQRVPSVAPRANNVGDVGIRFFNDGAIASLNGQLEAAGDALGLSNFIGRNIDGSDAAISFVARVYAGVNNFAPLVATIPGTVLAGGAVVPPFSGTDFYVEVEALADNVFMHSISVGELSDDALLSLDDLVPAAPAGITRVWQAAHSLDDALLPATAGTGSIQWDNVPLPAGHTITLTIDDTVPNVGSYQNQASIDAAPSDDGVWNATGQAITIDPPPPDLADCNGATDIQGRQAYLHGFLKGVNAPAFGVFRVYNAGTNNLVFTSDPTPGNGAAMQAVEAVVPFGASALNPGTAYDFVLEVYDASAQLVTMSGRCSFTTQASFAYLSCAAPWDADRIRHAVLITNEAPMLINDSGQNRVGPVGFLGGQDAFNVTYEFWNGSTWVLATLKTAANSYGAPASIANPRAFGASGDLAQLAITNLAGDGQTYIVRKTLRNGANQSIEQVQCAPLTTATVPPLQCADAVNAISDDGATLTFGPIDRSQYAFAEQDQIRVQVRPAGSTEPFQTVGTTTLPNGEGTARFTDTVMIPISGLEPGTAYDTRIIYTSDPGFPVTGYQGAVCTASFVTTGEPPIVTAAGCNGAVAITLNSATVNGTASADAGNSAYIEWSAAQNGPFTAGSPPVAIDGEDVPVSANLAGLSPARTYYFRTVIVNTLTNAVQAISSTCSFQTRTPNAFITPTSSADCPPTADVEAAEPPMDVTVTHTLAHSGGADAITGDLSIDLTSFPQGATLTSWSATTSGVVTGSALNGVTPPDETLTLAPGSSIAYTLVYHVAGPSGGDLASTMTFAGPGVSQRWQATAECSIRDKRLDCEPAFASVGDIPRDRPLRQVSYDGVSYNVQLEPGWTLNELVDSLNAQGGQFATDGVSLFTTPESRWAHGALTFTYLDNPTVIDFGTGGANGNRVSSPDTTYTFVPSGPIDSVEEYAITSFSDTGLGFQNTENFTITADALGDPNGNAMIVNGSAAPGVFAKITIPTIPGERYATSFFAVNTTTFAAVDPNITVTFADSLGNTIPGSVSTGDITTSRWTQYLVDVVATDTELTFVFNNNAGGAAGNDLALDQIEAGLVVTETVQFAAGECPSLTADFTYNPNGATTCETGCITNTATAWPFVLPPCAQPCPPVVE